MSSWSPDRFAEAWGFATRYHQGQTYGGPAPGEQIAYLNHIAQVAAEVIWALPTAPHANGDLAVQCALLHDVLEDTAATHAQLAAQFGPLVAAGVQALTKDASLPKDEQMPDSLRRILQQPAEIAMVKLADRITNLAHPPFYWQRPKIAAYRQEAIAIHTALQAASPALAERLWQKIERYARFLA